MSEHAAVAQTLVRGLAPYCERIEIAGSVRRGKPNPHDIELVCVPKLERAPVASDLFGESFTTRNLLDELLIDWRAKCYLEHRRDKNGRPAWGERFKRTNYVMSSRGYRYALDIFSVLPPAQWGVLFTIRTGSAEFSHRLVTSRLQGGLLPPDMRVANGGLYQAGGLIQTPEERDFFDAIGLGYIEPEARL